VQRDGCSVTILRAVPFSVAMTLRFRRVTHRSGMLLEGPEGWGEFSPFLDYGPEYAARWLEAAIDAATRPFPAPQRTSVPVNATIPAVDAERAYELARASGCHTAKVKVAEPGQRLADDIDRVAAVRDALGPRAAIRVDANAAWDVDTAADALSRLSQAAGGLQYAEQPCATLDELRQLRTRTDVLLAADESVRTAEDPERIAGLDAADLLVIKVQPLGGVHRARQVVDAAGLPVVVSSAVETTIGLAAGAAFAAGLDDLPYACGLGTGTMLAADVVDDPLVPVNGEIPVGRRAPDAARLAQAVAAGDEAADLEARFVAAIAYLPSDARELLGPDPTSLVDRSAA